MVSADALVAELLFHYWLCFINLLSVVILKAKKKLFLNHTVIERMGFGPFHKYIKH